MLVYYDDREELPFAEMTLIASDSSNAEMYPRVIIPGSLA